MEKITWKSQIPQKISIQNIFFKNPLNSTVRKQTIQFKNEKGI